MNPTKNNADDTKKTGTWRVKVGLAEMLKGGVIMDVTNPEQAKIAEDAGAVAVMALERVPADIRRDGGIARMSDPEMIIRIKEAVTIPVMAKCRIGHFAEAQILEALGVDFVDESEVLTPADEANHVWKHDFKVPFVCGCRGLGEALRRVGEGAAMIRTKGEAGTGDIVEAVRHMRKVQSEIHWLYKSDETELPTKAKELQAPLGVGALGRQSTASCPCRTSPPAASRHPRTLADDAAWRGDGLRGQRHLQERRPRTARARHRAGRAALRGADDARGDRARLGEADEGIDVATCPKSSAWPGAAGRFTLYATFTNCTADIYGKYGGVKAGYRCRRKGLMLYFPLAGNGISRLN